jgi:hypothetical protein
VARGGFVYIILNFQKRNPQHSPGVLGIDTGEVGTEKLIRESVIRENLIQVPRRRLVVTSPQFTTEYGLERSMGIKLSQTK